MTEGDDRREQLREWGRAGGKIGGKRRLETMTKAKRTKLAYDAGVQGGRPVVIDRGKVREMREKGLKYREIAEAMGIGMASVARILREAK